MQARLVGGPYDGGSDDLIERTAPGEVKAFKCQRCEGIHIIDVTNPFDPPNAIRYRFAETDAWGAVYVYGEPRVWRERNREKELVGA